MKPTDKVEVKLEGPYSPAAWDFATSSRDYPGDGDGDNALVFVGVGKSRLSAVQSALAEMQSQMRHRKALSHEITDAVYTRIAGTVDASPSGAETVGEVEVNLYATITVKDGQIS